MITYAQNAEDVVLARAFPSDSGFYIDVGAAHPTYHSVTRHFYDRGWRGVNVEPHPRFFELLKQERPDDVNVHAGIGDRRGTLQFYEDLDLPGNSTFSAEVASAYAEQGSRFLEREIDVVTLAELCEEHAPDQIDFLKIDVEGFERNVLLGADFDRFRPRALVIEAIDPGTKTRDVSAWESLVRDADYVLTLHDGINDFYVARGEDELAEVLAVPANFLDEPVPFDQVEQIDALERRVAALMGRVERAEALASGREAALIETRERLARSRLELRDARFELESVKAALMADGVQTLER